MQIWGEPSQEITARIKYAKYHALRIAKAVKAGEDPNDSNPAIEPPAPEENVQLDPNDPEVRDITGAPKQPTVEDVPDEEGEPRDIPPPVRPLSAASKEAEDNPYDLLPSAANHHPSQPPLGTNIVGSPPTSNVNSRQGSVGGGYFPVTQEEDSTEVPDPEILSPSTSIPPLTATSPPYDPQDYYTSQPTPPAPSAPSLPPKNPLPPKPQPRAAPPPPAPPLQAQDGTLNTDDESVYAAMKHAKFAISALNFEDVPTAVKELRAALQSLGAR